MKARLADLKRTACKLEEIIARNFDFSNSQKTLTYKNAGDSKAKHRQTRTKCFRNPTQPKDNTANETNEVLQTQLTRNFAERNQDSFENLLNQKVRLPTKPTQPVKT